MAAVGFILLAISAAGAVMDDIQPWSAALAAGGIVLILAGVVSGTRSG